MTTVGDYESNDLEGVAHLAADAGYDGRPTRAVAVLDDWNDDDEPDCSWCGERGCSHDPVTGAGQGATR